MEKLAYIISHMNEREVEDIIIQWAKEEGWNPGLHDAASFYAQDPQGFFIARLDHQPIGCSSAVIYDENFAFFGCYIVKREFRHQGYGIQMTRRRLEYVGNRNIGLDGVIHMCDKYANIGFRPAHMNIRYQGRLSIKENNASDPHIISISEQLISSIEKYDRLYFPAPRRAFLNEWLKQSLDKMANAYIQDGIVKGYGVIRKCFLGYKIGPLFADSYEIAEKIFRSLVVKAQGDVFFLDIPEPNTAALALVKHYKMEPSFKTLRMYTKGVPDINLDRVFGITTFELG